MLLKPTKLCNAVRKNYLKIWLDNWFLQHDNAPLSSLTLWRKKNSKVGPSIFFTRFDVLWLLALSRCFINFFGNFMARPRIFICTFFLKQHTFLTASNENFHSFFQPTRSINFLIGDCQTRRPKYSVVYLVVKKTSRSRPYTINLYNLTSSFAMPLANCTRYRADYVYFTANRWTVKAVWKSFTWIYPPLCTSGLDGT